MNQITEEERHALVRKKHANDRICRNCRFFEDVSAFPQYESHWKCIIDDQSVVPEHDACPAFEK